MSRLRIRRTAAHHSPHHFAMKSPFLSLVGLSLLACTLVAPVQAQNDTPKEKPTETAVKKQAKKPVKKSRSEVVNKLNALGLTNAELDPKARFFIYLQSASWCGSCCMEMPGFVKAYPEMKENGVEIILLGHDRTTEEMEAFIKKFNIPFPSIQYKTRGVGDLPGYRSSPGIPWATRVDFNGNILMHSHAEKVFKNWKETTDPKTAKKLAKEYKDAERKAERDRKKKK